MHVFVRLCVCACVCGRVAQEIGGHAPHFFDQGEPLVDYWLQLVLGACRGAGSPAAAVVLGTTHQVCITGPYVAIVRKDRL